MKAFGHIKLSRKAFDGDQGDPFWHEDREFSRWEAWVDLLQLAQWKPRRHAGIELSRGEFVASLRTLARRWRWSKSRVERYLEAVEKSGRVAGQRTGHAGRVYLVVNYDAYQGDRPPRGTDGGTPVGTEAGQERDKNKQEKQEKQNNNTSSGEYDPRFERAWSAYPKRSGGNPKRGAYLAWQASVRRGGDPQAMEDGTHRYKKFCEATNLINTRYVKQGATFYGPNECWTDDWDVPLTVQRGAKDRNYDDPTRSDYVGVVDGWMSPELERLTRPRAS